MGESSSTGRFYISLRDCPTFAVMSDLPFPQLVNGRMTWGGPLSSNKGMTYDQPTLASYL